MDELRKLVREQPRGASPPADLLLPTRRRAALQRTQNSLSQREFERRKSDLWDEVLAVAWRAAGLLKAVPRLPSDARIHQGTEAVEADPNARFIFQCNKIGKTYYAAAGFKLAGVSFDLEPGRILAVIGRNGSGKTTLLNLVAGILEHSAGGLAYPTLKGKLLHEVPKFIGHVKQAPEFEGRLKGYLREYASNNDEARTETIDRWIDEVLEKVGLENKQESACSELSSGYRMRAELARIMLAGNRLLVLDEPFGPLDPDGKQIFFKILPQLAALPNPTAVIFSAAQDYLEVLQIAHEVIALAPDGGVYYCGPIERFHQPEEDFVLEFVLRKELVDMRLVLKGTNATCYAKLPYNKYLVRVPVGGDCEAVIGCLTQYDILGYQKVSGHLSPLLGGMDTERSWLVL